MQRTELLKRASTFFRLTHSHKFYGDFMHVNCKSCGHETGRSGVYLPRIGMYMCYQPHCNFIKNPKYHNVTSYLHEILGDKWEEELLEYEEDKNFLPAENRYDYNTTYSPQGITTRETLLPKSSIPIIDGSGGLADDARNYLMSRGIGIEEAWDRYKVHYVKDFTYDEKDYFGYIIFPFFDKNGKIIYYQGRDYTHQNKRRYLNPKAGDLYVNKNTIVFNEQDLPFYDRLYLVEGVFDAVELSKVCLDEPVPGLGISVLGMEIHERQLHKIMRSNAKEIYIIPDDGSYFKWLEHGYRMIGQGKDIYVLSFHHEEHEGKILKDSSDFGKPRIVEACKNLKPLTEATYAQEKFYIKRINKYFYSGLQPLYLPHV